MSNMKIISIIDHENRTMRSDVMTAIAQVVHDAFTPLEQKLEQLQERVKKLEEGVSPKLSG